MGATLRVLLPFKEGHIRLGNSLGCLTAGVLAVRGGGSMGTSGGNDSPPGAPSPAAGVEVRVHEASVGWPLGGLVVDP